ncbi:MAG: hypothetical protein ABSE40_05260 [Candidatus Sulfotelmatobacter sp.]|jgi:hypothetical protein
MSIDIIVILWGLCKAKENRQILLGKADPAQYFSKHILSQYIRENAAKIDSTGFAGLLDRIVAAIEAHQSKQAVVAQSVNVAVAKP